MSSKDISFVSETSFRKTQWHGFFAETFLFEGKKAEIVIPKEPDRDRNWLFKMEYWDAFPAREIDLLNRGFHLVYLENETRFATREDCDRKARFCDYLAERYGLRNVCVPVGLSCGGAHAVNFAGFYPEKVACLYLDAPVLNFCDYPGRYDDRETETVWETEFVKAYPGITRSTLLDSSWHPIKRAKELVRRKIPVVMLYGTQDTTVSFNQNGRLLIDAYAGEPSLMLAVPRMLQGHHPHGEIQDPECIIFFIINACTKAKNGE